MSNTKTYRTALPFVALLAAGLSQPALALGPTEAPEQPPAKHQEPPTVPTSAKSATKLELDAIRTQNALAAERSKAMSAATGANGGPTVPAMDARPIAVVDAPGRSGSRSPSSSKVTMVAGPVGQLAATIQTPMGLIVAHVGDRVPDVGTIRAISVNQVLREEGKRITPIPFAAEPASSLIQGGTPTPGNMAMPGAGLPYGGQ